MNILLEELFKTDLQRLSDRKSLLRTIEDDLKNQTGYREVIFNIFNIDIYYKENKIKIEEDFELTGEEEVILSITEFIEELKKNL